MNKAKNETFEVLNYGLIQLAIIRLFEGNPSC